LSNYHQNEDEKILELLNKSIIIDGLQLAVDVEKADYFEKLMNELIDIGITSGSITLIPTNANPLKAFENLSTWINILEKCNNKVIVVSKAQDIEEAKAQGKFGVIMNSQNGDILEKEVNLLAAYKKLGLRIIQLTYYGQNLLGEGSCERTNGGLSNFGVEVVKEMNRLGLIIDVSHSGDQVTLDAINYSDHPIIISHSNARSLVNHERNKTDKQIIALAEKGGVIGLTLYSTFCEVRQNVRPTFEDFFKIFDYVVKLVGIDHVGLGLDLALFRERNSWERWAKLYPDLAPKGGFCERNITTDQDGKDHPEQIIEIIKGLIARNYSETDIQKILGLNFLRVFKEVWG